VCDSQPLILDRDAELTAITAAITAAAGGRGTLIVVQGPAGIGKTAILRAACAEAGAQGMRTLAARGLALEQGFSYGVVRQLLEPVHAAAGPGEWDALLDGAARLARPVFDGAEPSPAGATAQEGGVPHATVHGLYWLTANLADREPLVLAVDDAHWADAASLRVLLDVQAEISAQRVALVVASRPVENPEVQRLLAAMAAHPDCTVLSPETLSRAAVEELASERLGGPAGDDFVAECLQVSRGNPFYVTELLRSFEPGARLDPQALRLDGTLSLQRTMSWRLGELGPAAAALAQAAAVLGDGCSLRYAAELAQLGDAVAAG
jgi:predicted ATPase